MELEGLPTSLKSQDEQAPEEDQDVGTAYMAEGGRKKIGRDQLEFE